MSVRQDKLDKSEDGQSGGRGRREEEGEGREEKCMIVEKSG